MWFFKKKKEIDLSLYFTYPCRTCGKRTVTMPYCNEHAPLIQLQPAVVEALGCVAMKDKQH